MSHFSSDDLWRHRREPVIFVEIIKTVRYANASRHESGRAMIGELFKYWTYQVFSPGTVLREKYEAFRSLLELDQRAHEGMAELQRICYEAQPVDANRVNECYQNFSSSVGQIVDLLEHMCPRCYSDLKAYHTKFDHYIRHLLAAPDAVSPSGESYTLGLLPVSDLDMHLVGGKAHTLMRVVNRLGMNIPRGFVITTNAYHHLIDINRVDGTIRRNLARIHPDDPSTLVTVSEKLTAVIMEIDIPKQLTQAFQEALHAFIPSENDDMHLAVRSSAVGEDSDITFAGQYHSCLEVDPDEIVTAYRRVIASRFSPTALYYRIRAGFDDSETPMAVVVMEMIDPLLSGVLYTRGPTPEQSNTSSLHYVSGLGEDLVSGKRKANVISIPHDADGRPVASDYRDTNLSVQTASAMNPSTIKALSDWVLPLERLMQTPCDVEWCQDMSGRIYLLQCRPLYQQPPDTQLTDIDEKQADTLEEATVLYKGGECACSGMGSGPIHKISNDADIRTLPDKGVALLTTAPPHYIPILDRVSAVIIERGSIAGHFQAVAREFNVPTLVNTENAGDLLQQGSPVTVIAQKCEVLAGIKAQTETTPRGLASKDNLNPLQRRLAAAMDFISPLKLTDPHAPSFAPQSCRSMHDILRFAHEKAIYEMFSIGDRRMKRKSGARRLIGDLPMAIYVLDVGGGILPAKAKNQTIRIEDLICRPLHALWKGLMHPDIQWSGHHHFDWAEYDRLVMNGGIVSPESAMFSSYAVVADQYLNFCLKFGYHFAIIDTLLQKSPNSGHIWFRFTGGGADALGRLLRVRFTTAILNELGFSVKTEGELINARLEGHDSPMVTETLERIGHLLGVTRLMDMHLQNESEVDRLVDAYLNGQFADFVWETEEEEGHER